MRWRGGRRSGNVEDRRGAGGAGLKVGGTGALVLVVVALGVAAFGGDPGAVLDLLGGSGGGAPSASSPEEDELAEFTSVVLADTEDTWTALFRARGETYEAPKLVLFRDAVQSACGRQGASVGPFYCPGDHKAYLDLGFFDQLARLGAPGDFAQAYVIAHEIGHHVQNLEGTSARAAARERTLPEAEANAVSVQVELQADCYAGVWGHHAQKRQLLEAGDLEEGLGAAAAIGDDTLQRRAGGRVAPESFTHGSSAQRVHWFRVGFDGGDPSACDTFGPGGR